MSKRSSDGRAIQPVVPQVSPDKWKKLFAAAKDFNRLAPWTWMHDSQITGLRNPLTSEVLLGSILGRLRSVFGLLLYRNAAGHRWLLEMILNEGDVEDDDNGFEQDAIKLEFVPKRELSKEDSAVLRAANYSPSAKRGPVWPQVRSIVPGAFPWHASQAEAEALLFALPRVAALSCLARENPKLWDSHRDGEIAFLPDDFDPAAAKLRAEQIDWRPMLPPHGPPPGFVLLEDDALARLASLKPAKGFHLEMDVCYFTSPIGAADRPWFPKLAMAVDRHSGYVYGFHLGSRDDRNGAAALATVLKSALTQFGVRPELICVQRPRVAAMLENVAVQLGIPLVLDYALDELNAAKDSMLAHFANR